jgi:hypothetical protein
MSPLLGLDSYFAVTGFPQRGFGGAASTTPALGAPPL